MTSIQNVYNNYEICRQAKLGGWARVHHGQRGSEEWDRFEEKDLRKIWDGFEEKDDSNLSQIPRYTESKQRKIILYSKSDGEQRKWFFTFTF